MAMPALDPWGSDLPADYEKIISQFGLDRFDAGMLPDPNAQMRHGGVFACRDLGRVAQCIRQKKPFYCLTGIMPTADTIHFGNKMVIENVRYFQDHGATAYVLVADLEANATRGVSLEEGRRRALEFHIPAYLALGLDPRKTVFYFQSENKDVLHLAYDFSKHITLNEFRAVYGSADPGRILGALTQSGDMLFPQLAQRMPGVIPVGIDQDPHIRLCRDIIARTKGKYGFVPISSIYCKFTRSLDGSLKMSKSRPASCLNFPEDVESVAKKLKVAKTGGRTTVEEQKRLGGNPDDCVIFDLYRLHLIDKDAELAKVYKDCKAGKLLCGEDKKRCIGLMAGLMQDFDANVAKYRKQVDKLNFVKFS